MPASKSICSGLNSTPQHLSTSSIISSKHFESTSPTSSRRVEASMPPSLDSSRLPLGGSMAKMVLRIDSPVVVEFDIEMLKKEGQSIVIGLTIGVEWPILHLVNMARHHVARQSLTA